MPKAKTSRYQRRASSRPSPRVPGTPKPKAKAPKVRKGADLRNPANANLRRLVGTVQEDAAEDLKKSKAKLSLGGFQLTPEMIQMLIAIFGPLIAGAINRPPPAPAPVPTPAPVPEPQPGTTPTPQPTPSQPGAVARIIGGKAKITGLTERGAQGPRVSNWKAIAEGRDNAPNDCRFEFDCTPTDGVKDFAPATSSGVEDPRWAGQPSNSEDWAFPMRLFYTYEGPGSADISREYASFGCSPRIRVRQPEGSSGTLTDLYFKGPDYGDGKPPAIIPVTDGPIYIGRH